MAQEAKVGGGVGRDAISMLAAATFLVWADRQVVVPLLPAMAHGFHASLTAVAETVSVYSLCYGLFQLMYGNASDRLGRIRVMSAAMQVFGLATLAVGLMPSLGAVVALRGLSGAGAAAVMPLSLAYVGDTVAIERRQAAIGRINTANAMGQAFSVALGGLVAAVTSWRLLFIGYGVLSSLLAWRLARAPESRVERTAGPIWQSMRQVLAAPGVARLYGLALLDGVTVLGAYVFLSPALKAQGVGYLVVGLALAVFGPTSLVASRLLARMAERFGPIALPWLGGAAAVLAYAVAAWRITLWTTVLSAGLLGLAYAWIHSSLQTWATAAYPPARATTVSGFAFWVFVGAGIGTQALAPLATGGHYRTLFLLAGGIGALLTVLTGLSFGGSVVVQGWRAARSRTAPPV